MNVMIRFLLAMIMTATAAPLVAQNQPREPYGHGNMMQGAGTNSAVCAMQDGMMSMPMAMTELAMHDPIRRSEILTRVLPTMRDELGLSEDQEKRLTKIAEDERTSESTQLTKANKIDEEIQELVSSEKADGMRLRGMMREAAELRADIRTQRWQSAMMMKRELSDDQLKKLDGIAPTAICRQTMSAMSGSEMMGMMGMMHEMQGGSMMGAMSMYGNGMMSHGRQ